MGCPRYRKGERLCDGVNLYMEALYKLLRLNDHQLMEFFLLVEAELRQEALLPSEADPDLMS